jgi:acetyl esterase/lipase
MLQRQTPRSIQIAVALLWNFAAFNTHLSAQERAKPTEILLWPDGAPGAAGTADEDRPMLTMHAPADANKNGCAVIVCPGGGYGHLAMSYEGHDVAEWFNTFGVTGFVLRYRLAPKYRHPAPLADVQRAIRTVRARAGEWGLDANRIGVLGFSAGGHLASTAATHFDAGQIHAADAIEHASCRPDFAVLCYPVISFTTNYTHKGSLKNLLGEQPEPALVENLSNEKQVTKETPPTFLFHTSADTGVPAENSVLFYLALKKAGVPAELHVYEPGPHGVGLALKDPTLSSWPKLLETWMLQRKLLEKK